MRVSEMFPSKFYKHPDLDGKPAMKVIDFVEEQEIGRNGDRCPVLFFEGEPRGMVLNKTNARFLATKFGDDSGGWKGKEVILFPAVVDYAGKPTPTIRLRVKPVLQSAPRDASTL